MKLSYRSAYLGAALLGLTMGGAAEAKDIAVSAGADAQQRLQEALIEAEPGDVVVIGEGRFDLTDGLSLDVDRVTVRGAGPDKTVLSFKNQMGAGEGLLVTSDDVVLRDFAVEDTRGDGIKSKDADRIVYHNLRVEWTGGPKETNGAYGVYPVESQWVLVDAVVVKGASDAGIYVGQSSDIIVRNSVVEQNVAGIEIENSSRADVYGNVATHNTGGILVFDLPNLPIGDGHDVRVFKNAVTENDTPNFAPKGNIVATVPNGTGIMIMAQRNVEIFENAIGKNATANVMLVTYPKPYEDAGFDPYPRDITVRDNAHDVAGFKPGFPGGEQLAAAFGGAIPPIFWDGIGGTALNLRVLDAVPVLSLGLTAQGDGPEKANPALVELKNTVGGVLPLTPVTLPQSMEDAVK